MNEFDLIRRYFSRPVPAGYLGGGDDCALLPIGVGLQLATSTDLLIEGRHFLPGADPRCLGHKALAVNISDLAAMGAKPLGCVLGLSLPRVDERWLSEFSDGFYSLAEQAACPLVGGDTTRSDGIVISVTVYGQVDPALALRRDAARLGDDIWVTGTLGAPHVALQFLTHKLSPDPELLAAVRPALERPQPPWKFAQHLPGLAHAALDISDGLLQDLGHILAASQYGAVLHYACLPIDPALDKLNEPLRREAALAGGDVYQLCFTAAPNHRAAIEKLANEHAVQVSRIGFIQEPPGLVVLDDSGVPLSVAHAGFDHFS
ncbi:MAG TPA: thiamine-phosphate kinase [Pusillimonas sp.]|uniref:thiamine-phosphate kinase n=1 Tax=unclassified Pusillimonas TaxID=2640016 RepID=UPI0026201D8A|nr:MULTISPECIES: thiamine-phosphate kinase [unclassified Pusillimonas]HLU19524.1 thiamine-phosphate kinase [Pusillimonas sp.]